MGAGYGRVEDTAQPPGLELRALITEGWGDGSSHYTIQAPPQLQYIYCTQQLGLAKPPNTHISSTVCLHLYHKHYQISNSNIKQSML